MSEHEIKTEMNQMITAHVGLSLIGLCLMVVCLVHNIGQ